MWFIKVYWKNYKEFQIINKFRYKLWSYESDKIQIKIFEEKVLLINIILNEKPTFKWN